MDELQQLSYSDLIDLLGKKTSEYTGMLKNGIRTEQFIACKQMIERLTAEIELRKRKGESRSPDDKNQHKRDQ